MLQQVNEEEMLRKGLEGRWWRYDPALDTFVEEQVGYLWCGEYKPRIPQEFSPKRREACSQGARLRINWTEEMDAELIHRWRDLHETHNAIAEHFGYSRNAIRSRIEILKDGGIIY